MNERDSDAVASMLVNRGYSMVKDEDDADIVLLNTCSVREQAEQKAIGKAGYLKRRKRKNQNFIIGVMGCMVQNRGEKLLDQLPDVDLLIGTQKFHHVPDYLDSLVADRKNETPTPSAIIDLGEEEGSQNTIVGHDYDIKKVTSFVSIMQGCNMSCSFCIVPKTRGEERARPIQSIVDEVKGLVEKGTREVTLLGQIVTSYGRREIAFKESKSPFVQLLEELSEIEDLKRIRFTSPHPRGFKDDLVQAYKRLPKLCQYVHLPVQSGSNDILKAMNRPYTRERYMQLIDELKEVVPNMHFSTDIIVGYPGETDEDFALTKKLFDYVKFDMAFIFKYSQREGTPAADIEDQIPKKIKEARNQELLAALTSYSNARNASLIGTTEEILVEGPAKKGEGMYVGRTKGYRKVVFPGNERLVGELINVKIGSSTVTSVSGTVV